MVCRFLPFLPVLAWNALVTAFAFAAAPSSWQPIFDQAGSGITWGVALEGPLPYSRNEGTVFKPASVSKLFTYGAAVSRLGPDFRFETKMEWKGATGSPRSEVTELRFTGSGDPSWGMSEFGETPDTRAKEFVQALKSRGVRAVHGPIRFVADDPRWDDARYPEGWDAGDRAACYGALARAFNLDLNCAAFIVTGPAAGRFEEREVDMPVLFSIRTGLVTDLTVNPSGRGYLISGIWNPKSPPQRLLLPLTDPAAWLSNLVLKHLRASGISWSQAPVPATGPVESYVTYSPPLRALMVPFLKQSLNVVGDAWLRVLGRRVGPARADLLTAGQSVLADYVARLGLRGVRLLDGSGLSSESSVTPEDVLELLHSLSRSPDLAILLGALPLAGRDGTLVNRMKGTAAEGLLRAKTGTLSGVYNLAGFVPGPDTSGSVADLIPFVMLTDTGAGRGAEVHAAQDRAGATLTRLVNSRGKR